jgi:hypothetical protein
MSNETSAHPNPVGALNASLTELLKKAQAISDKVTQLQDKVQYLIDTQEVDKKF